MSQTKGARKSQPGGIAVVSPPESSPPVCPAAGVWTGYLATPTVTVERDVRRILYTPPPPATPVVLLRCGPGSKVRAWQGSAGLGEAVVGVGCPDRFLPNVQQPHLWWRVNSLWRWLLLREWLNESGVNLSIHPSLSESTPSPLPDSLLPDCPFCFLP